MANGRLKEVEEDAVYITEKRFADQREEAAREQAKRAREAAREESKLNGSSESLPEGGETYEPEEKKGK